MTNLTIDPELEPSMPEPFTLSIEPCNGPAYQHGFHLGTHEPLARAFAEEIWKRVNTERGCYTVALMQPDGHGWMRIVDVYDGRDWSDDVNAKMWNEINDYRVDEMLRPLTAKSTIEVYRELLAGQFKPADVQGSLDHMPEPDEGEDLSGSRLLGTDYKS